MTIKPTTLLFLLLSATLALSQHPEKLQQCKDQCQKVYGGQELEFQCKRICEEQQIKPESARRGDNPWEKEQLRSCKDKCEHLGRPRKEHCEQDCEHKYKGGDGNSLGESDHQNPYFFGRERFKDWVRSQQGKIQILERFDERSELLAGIANYRVEILEAVPQTLVIPKHTDADDLFYVANGEGVINLLRENSRESHELRRGHIFRVPAGTIVYIINTHNQQKLCLVQLLQPVSTPGEFETFFDAGGETYFRSFSDEVMEAAFNAPKERIDRVFSKQNKGVIFKVSRKQIEQLSRKSSSEGGTVWPFGGAESKQGPFNILGKRPSHKNQRGVHYEADESDYKQLNDLDIKISYANVTGGSMISPYYLSRSTEVSVIISGKGYVEIVCPHLASEKSKRWEKEQQLGQQEQGQEQEQQPRQQEQEQQGSEQGKEQKRREQEQGQKGSEQGKEQKRREQEQGQQGSEQGKEQKHREQEEEQEQGQQGREQRKEQKRREQEQGQQGSEQGEKEKQREQEQGQQGKEQKREQEEEQKHGQQGKEQKRREQEQAQEQGQEQKQGQQGKEQKRREQEQEQEQGPRYERIRSNVSPGTVVVTPAGHPSVWVASKGESLEVLRFEINARNNQRYSLAGEDNILKKLEDVAKELAYGTSAKEVNALFDAQDEKMFVAGPEERKEGRGGKRPLESIMNFAGF